MERDIVQRIQQFNQGRNPELLRLKYQTMAKDAFSFLRGTCHLFYQDWPVDSPLNQAPWVWICGDLHLENFGSYKGGDMLDRMGSRQHLIYFDLNDFDEAALAPCTWDLARFLTSILVAARTLHIHEIDAQALCQNFLVAYTTTLAKGQVGSVSRETATGLVKELLQSVKKRRRKDFLNQRTKKVGKSRTLKFIPEKVYPAPLDKQTAIAEQLQAWAQTQQNPNFFRVLDVAYRIAGTGSLGLERYTLLVEGKGSPDHNYLLDLKAARPSSLQPYLTVPQPDWQTEAERVVTIQQRLQWAAPALLSAVELEGKSYILRELQPLEDRVNLGHWNGKLRRLRKVIEIMAEVLAWGSLLSSGRQGSAIADDLIQFAQTPTWQKDLLEIAHTYANQVEVDYQTFRQALEAGAIVGPETKPARAIEVGSSVEW